MKWSTDGFATGSVQAQPFLFERRFDRFQEDLPEVAMAEPEEPVEPAPEPEPTVSQSELRLACERAFTEGQAAGRSLALGAFEQRLEESLTTLHAELASVHAAQAETRAHVAGSVVGIAMAVARTLLPALYARHAESEVEAMVTGMLASLRDVPPIRVRLSPDIAAALTPRLEQAAAAHGLQGRFAIDADAVVAPGDCCIEWAGGGAVRDQRRLWREIEHALAEAVGDAANPSAALPHPPHVKGVDHG